LDAVAVHWVLGVVVVVLSLFGIPSRNPPHLQSYSSE
jgi:hypothetical protein